MSQYWPWPAMGLLLIVVTWLIWYFVRHRPRLPVVRHRNRSPMSEDDFLQHFPVDMRKQKVLIIELRRELAEASGLAEEMIRPSDELFLDLVSGGGWPDAQEETIIDFIEDHCRKLSCSSHELELTKIKRVEDYIRTLTRAYSRNRSVQ